MTVFVFDTLAIIWWSQDHWTCKDCTRIRIWASYTAPLVAAKSVAYIFYILLGQWQRCPCGFINKCGTRSSHCFVHSLVHVDLSLKYHGWWYFDIFYKELFCFRCLWNIQVPGCSLETLQVLSAWRINWIWWGTQMVPRRPTYRIENNVKYIRVSSEDCELDWDYVEKSTKLVAA